jgi:hypothetical protein
VRPSEATNPAIRGHPWVEVINERTVRLPLFIPAMIRRIASIAWPGMGNLTPPLLEVPTSPPRGPIGQQGRRVNETSSGRSPTIGPMERAAWKRQVQEDPRPFLKTYLLLVVPGLAVILLGGLALNTGSHPDPSSNNITSNTSGTIGGIALITVGLLTLLLCLVLSVRTIAYWLAARRRRRREPLHP